MRMVGGSCRHRSATARRYCNRGKGGYILRRGGNWTGHSTGKWEGDTLVVDTIGLNGESWLDNSGHIYSNEVHLTERIRRADRNTLSIDVTIDDPKSFTKPWSGQRTATLQPGRVIRENLACGGIMNGE